MTDEQIIKALECCITNDCAKCKAYDETNGEIVDCLHTICRNALDLINRQKAEIERLNKLLSGAKDCIDEIEYAMEKVGTSNDRIDEAIEEWGTLVKELTEQTTFEKVEHNSLCETETYKGGE